MKTFKKSCILISVALVLLLCISAVSAGENTALDDNNDTAVTDSIQTTGIDEAGNDVSDDLTSIKLNDTDSKTDINKTVSNVSDSNDTAKNKSDKVVSKTGKKNVLASNNLGEGNSFTTLAGKIATTTGTLTLDSDYEYTSADSDYITGIPIAKSIIIDGQNLYTIDAKNLARIFIINSGKNVTLRGITFKNGYVSGDNDGAAVYSQGVLTVENCTFLNNNASYGQAGAIYAEGSNINISGSTFKNNFALYRGGAIFFTKSNHTLVQYCLFENNTAGLNGGGVDWFNGSEDGKLWDSVFINNTAWRSGGAVYWTGFNGSIGSCNFTDNYAKGNVSNDDKGIYTYTTLGGNGGAVAWLGSDGGLSNCTFKFNKAEKLGGALYLQRNQNVGVWFSNFTNNTANASGGAVAWSSGADNGHLWYCNFDNNTAKGSGGAIYWIGD